MGDVVKIEIISIHKNRLKIQIKTRGGNHEKCVPKMDVTFGNLAHVGGGGKLR